MTGFNVQCFIIVSLSSPLKRRILIECSTCFVRYEEIMDVFDGCNHIMCLRLHGWINVFSRLHRPQPAAYWR